MRASFFLGLMAMVLLTASDLQSQTPVVTPLAQPAAAVSAADQAAAQANLVLLQQLKTANAEMLKKQEAVLTTLDALQKAAEEIKIYSKRG